MVKKLSLGNGLTICQYSLCPVDYICTIRFGIFPADRKNVFFQTVGLTRCVFF